MAQKLVIVESPAKAKTINKYLGSDYKVLASFGHIRDLPPKDGSVDPEDDFSMRWELSDRASRPVSEITAAVKQSDAVFLASDPDREGEAIAWHIDQVLREKKVADHIPVRRITFNEITKTKVLEALEHPRAIDENLVDAYMARRALDYLVGFSLSPVLWRKLPGAKSAGRVQSVALRLICERESEIEKFNPQEFWTIDALFQGGKGAPFSAHLTQVRGQKLEKFSIQTGAEAEAIRAFLDKLSWHVGSIEKKQTKRHPFSPFTTSTLQQEASRKLGFGATRTMKIAQQLYEGIDIGGETVGLITYMRTDGVSLSQEAIVASRKLIAEAYGDTYVPKSPRIYKAAAKNAQEAHEAIRPTDMFRRPEALAKKLDSDSLKLYTLIWQRTMASQMESALIDQVTVDIDADTKDARFRATGSTVAFDGWLRVYREDRDEDEAAPEGEDSRLPPLSEAEALKAKSILPNQHFTQPPPRYTEASLVKKLEELGIGRPSTYASIMQVLQERDYVRLEKRAFIPEDRGRIVTAFLENFFGRYVEYNFTAALEEKLDDISGGRAPWKNVMRDFWGAFSKAIDGTKDLKISDVIDALDEALGPHFFPPRADGVDPRLCPVCGNGRLGLKLGRYGAFLGCSNYPTCKNTQPLAVSGSDAASDAARLPPRELGNDPATGLPVSVRVGPYGAYVQLGPAPEVAKPEEPATEKVEAEAETKKKKTTRKKKDTAPKPKRASLPKGMDANLLNMDTALALLNLPRDVGTHPETAEKITAGIGRFGAYIKMGSRYKSLPEADDVLSIGLNRAVVLLAEPDKGRGGAGGSAKQLGEHPDDKKSITLNKGRFGPYVKWGKVMATVTKAYDPETLTLAQAIELLAAKVAKGGTGKKAKTTKAAPKEKKAPAKKKAPTKKETATPKKKAEAPAKKATRKKA